MALPWNKLGNKTYTSAKSLGRWVKKPRGAEARVDSDTQVIQVIQVVQARGCWVGRSGRTLGALWTRS